VIARSRGSRRRAAKDRAFALLALAFRVRERPAPSRPAKILIIQLQQVGDTVIFTPTLRALRKRFADCRIDVVANPASAQLYRASPNVDHLMVVEGWNAPNLWRRFRAMLSIVTTLRREHYDCAVTDVTEQSFAYALLAYLSGSPVRVGFDIGDRGFLHTVRIPFDARLPYVLCNLAIARALGADDSDPREEIGLSAGDRAEAARKLLAAGVAEHVPFAVIHPGSNWQSKTWYSDRWARLADVLAERYGYQVVFVGTASEMLLVEAARREMRNRSATLVAGTTLAELAAVISKAAIFVGTDSGPRNIAGALGVPNVTVMSAQEDTDRWRGVRAGETVIRSNPRCTGCYLAYCAHRLCMDVIDVQQLTAAVAAAIRGGRTAAPRLEVTAVPTSAYVALAGSPDADCATLRRLAKA
jgi:ADP-heptose:LPS heptosyltransferase